MDALVPRGTIVPPCMSLATSDASLLVLAIESPTQSV